MKNILKIKIDLLEAVFNVWKVSVAYEKTNSFQTSFTTLFQLNSSIVRHS